SWSMGNVITTEAPLVADVAYGLDDLIVAVEGMMTPAIKAKVQERSEEVRKATERNKKLRAQLVKNPDWNNSPLLADRLTYEVAPFADKNASIDQAAAAAGPHSSYS